MRVALYCRVSTSDQAIHGISIEAQLANLHEWAKENGHVIAGEYIDAGVSGRLPLHKRPELSRFIADLEHGLSVDALVFTKIDRFFRSVQQYYQTITELDKHHVSWIAIQEDYETVSSAGKFKVNIMLSVAQAESERTSERIKTVMDRKQVKGEWCSGHAPIGYKMDNKRLTIDESTAPIVRECFATLIRTGSIGEVTEFLHSQGIIRYYTTVNRLLRNEIYTGYHKGNPSFCPPIIDRETFSLAQSTILTPTKRTPTGRVYLLSGLVYCGKCGHSMAGAYRRDHSSPYSYRCNRCYITHLCDMSHIASERKIINFLLDKLEQEVMSFSAPVSGRKKQRKPVDNSKKLERLNELYIEGMIDKKTYLAKRKVLTIPVHQETTADYSAIKELVVEGNLRERYHSLSRQEQRELWRSVIQKIEIAGRDDITITFLP